MALIYLAGPEVFLTNAHEIGRRKQAICRRHGLEGWFPLDADPSQNGGGDPSQRIYDACIAGLHTADAVIANLTPFRGISADVGTVYELGFALALGKPVFGYSNVAATLRSRVHATLGAGGSDEQTHAPLAGDGMVVEDFGLADNLMIAEGLRSQGRPMVLRDLNEATIWNDLDAFEACVLKAASHFACHPAAATSTTP